MGCAAAVRPGGPAVISPPIARGGAALEIGERTMNAPKGVEDRGKINMHAPHEVKCWARKLGVSSEQLQRAVDKVGNSGAAVRKQLQNADTPSPRHVR